MVQTSDSAVATTGDEPVADVALCVEPERLLVYGDQNVPKVGYLGRRHSGRIRLAGGRGHS